MNYLSCYGCRFSFTFIVLLMLSCSKSPVADRESELYSLSFNFNGFTSTKQPLKNAFRTMEKLASTSGGTQTVGHLFFWSFNQETLYPDIRVPSSGQTAVTYNQGNLPDDYVTSTYTYAGFDAGKALNLQGANEIIFEMPLKDVQGITNLGFDIGSSNTGPKDFEIYYSTNGEDYEVIQLVNQLESATANAKNSFVYNLQDREIAGDRLWVKILPKAGDRMGGAEFNANMGTCRLDNFYLEGAYEMSQVNQISKLYYFIYHREEKDIYQVGEVDETELADFGLQLPLGTYDLMFVMNQSNLDLILPSGKVEWEDLFVGNYFSNGEAGVYGLVDQIEVSQDQSFTFTLERWYSQVKFEFTDADLSLADKIVVTPLHQPFYFSPSSYEIINPIPDQTTILFDEELSSTRQIVFNQFLGLQAEMKDVSYQLDVYAGERLIRTVTVSDRVKNNMQLIFRGELMKDVQAQGNFMLYKNEVWEGAVEAELP